MHKPVHRERALILIRVFARQYAIYSKLNEQRYLITIIHSIHNYITSQNIY